MQEGSIPANGEDALKVGSIVEADTKIGVMGNTGNSNRAHLHLSVFTGTSTPEFIGYFKPYGSEAHAEGTYYSTTPREDKFGYNNVYYNPLMVMQSNGLIIYHNNNDTHITKQKGE